VDGIEGINEKKEIIYFSCNKGNHTEKHLYMASFSTNKKSDLRCIIAEPGWNECVINIRLGLFSNVYSSVNKSPIVRLYILPDLINEKKKKR